MTPRTNLQCTGHQILRATHCFVHMTCNQRPNPPSAQMSACFTGGMSDGGDLPPGDINIVL